MKVWRAGYGLEVMDIPTPKVIAMIEKKSGPILLESFILTEWTEEGVGLDDFWNERSGPNSPAPLNRVERIALRKKVAEIFRRLHDLRISHGDLKGRNVLLDPRSPAPFSPQFVDLDAIRFSPIRFKRSRINDLSRLLFSVHPKAPLLTQVRFFKEYCGEDRRLWEERRDWWGRIRRRTERKLREKGLI
jgi:tRNA A-37 threonylcarbamoyl transferase component Bud32